MYKVSKIEAEFKTNKQAGSIFIKLYDKKQRGEEIKIYGSNIIIDRIARASSRKGHTQRALTLIEVIKKYKGVKRLTVITKKISILRNNII